MKLSSKAKFYEQFNRGLLGNKLRSFELPEAVPDGVQRPEMIMLRSVVQPQVPIYAGKTGKMLKLWKSLPAGCYQANETAPDEFATLQGEILELPGFGLYLGAFARERKHIGEMIQHREAMKRAVDYRNLSARTVLRHYLSPASYDDVQEVLELYPEHVIEFSTYAKNLGNRPGRNTIIWEVRKY